MPDMIASNEADVRSRISQKRLWTASLTTVGAKLAKLSRALAVQADDDVGLVTVVEPPRVIDEASSIMVAERL